MGLEKNFFKTGQVLEAKEMNDIEDAIVQNEIDIRVLEYKLDGKQETLKSGTNIKTINGQNILGSGNITLSGSGASVTIDSSLSDSSSNPVQNKTVTKELNKKQNTLVSGTNIKTVNGQSILGSGNIEIEGGSADANLYEEAKKLVSRFQHQYAINVTPPTEKEVDIILFSGQSNSCGRAQLSDCKYPEDFFLSTPISKAFHFNNEASTEPLEIIEPISANGSSTYGYIPAFLNAYYETTHRQVCACFMSVGGANLNKFVPYVLNENSEPTTTEGTYYKNMKSRVNHAKTQLSALGYTVGGIYLVWCQGENDAYYYGYSNNYATLKEESLTTPELKTAYYKDLFRTLVDALKKDIGLQAVFMMRIGHRKENPTKWEMYGPIVQAQNELCKEYSDCVMASTIFAGAEVFVEEDGTVRSLMRDYTHYKPEGYLRAGLEGGVNAGIFVNSGKRVKPILLEYQTLLFDDETVYERPVDKFIYDPCRVDLNLMKKFAADVVTSISLNFTQTTLGIGDTAQITATVYPTTVSNKKVSYVSNTPNIADVSDTGLITAKAVGSAIITVTSDATSSVTATINVTVSEAVVAVESITLNHNTASMLVGETLQLVATIKPDNATDKTITWKSSDGGAASVTNNGLVTALEQGDATITAVPNGNSSLSATCIIQLAHNATPSQTLLDLDFTSKTVADYISDGVLSAGDSTIDSLTYDSSGLVANDTDLTYGLKLSNPISVNQNWTVEIAMTIAAFADSGTSKTEAVYKNMAILSNNNDHDTHANTCLAPCLLNNGWKYAARLAEGVSTSNGSSAALFTADGTEHTYKFTFDASTGSLEWFIDGVSGGTKTWAIDTTPVAGNFGYVLGIHKGYPYSANYKPHAGVKIKSLKVSVN